MKDDITHTDALVRLDARISRLGKVLMGSIKTPVDEAFADVCAEHSAVKAQVESEQRQFRADLNAIADAAGIATDCASPSVGVIMTHVSRMRAKAYGDEVIVSVTDTSPSPAERRRVWADALVRHGGSDYAEEYLAAFDARFPQGCAR